MEQTTQEVWSDLTYDQKLAATDIVFKAVSDHMKQGGTYRYLIYERLGFDVDSYMILLSNGMYISNYISDNKGEQQ